MTVIKKEFSTKKINSTQYQYENVSFHTNRKFSYNDKKMDKKCLICILSYFDLYTHNNGFVNFNCIHLKSYYRNLTILCINSNSILLSRNFFRFSEESKISKFILQNP